MVNTSVYVNGIMAVTYLLFLWRRNIFFGTAAVISAFAVFLWGCYELINIERMSKFEGKPGYYTNFTVSFDLLCPAAIMVLLFVLSH